MSAPERGAPSTAGARIGTFVAVPDLGLAEALASAFDVLIVDLEHGPIDTAQAVGLLIAIQARDRSAYVRLAAHTDPRLSAILDAGVDGVVAPMIETADAAATFASRTRFPPSGRRGFGPRRAGDYGRASSLDRLQPVCAVQIESVAGIDAAPEIAKVGGVDLIVVGCSDLSVAFGTPGRLETAEIRDAIDRVGSAASEAGIGFGLATGGGVERVAALIRRPVDLLLYGLDLRMYVNAADSMATALREVVEDSDGSSELPRVADRPEETDARRIGG